MSTCIGCVATAEICSHYKPQAIHDPVNNVALHVSTIHLGVTVVHSTYYLTLHITVIDKAQKHAKDKNIFGQTYAGGIAVMWDR